MKREQLRELAFTDEFKAGEIFLNDVFNELECKVNKEDIYESGVIMSVIVNLNDGDNQKIIDTIVKDIESYIELTDLQAGTIAGVGNIELFSIIYHADKVLGQEVWYDWDNKEFI